MAMTAVILAAGEGTRMKSKHPKVMHEMLGRPLLWWAVRAAKEAGADRVVVVVGSGSDEVRAYFKDEDLIFVEQEKRLGTGHALMVVKEALGGFKGPVVVSYGDSPLIKPESIKALVDTRNETHSACVLLSMLADDPTGYGRVLEIDGQVEAIVEEKDCSDQQRLIKKANAGFYCFCGRRLTKYIDELSCDNAQGEYYLTDMVEIYRKNNEPVRSIVVDDANDVLGVNSRAQLLVASKVMQKRINERWMDAGVTLWDMDSIYIGPEVELEADVEILPNSMLLGKTTVKTGTTVGPNTRLINATVAENCLVDESVIVDSELESDVACGPRAYLRGHALMKQGSKAGTHVELKKTVVGEGSKVPHLSYLGDATLGKDVNIGGGTITCNYDGKRKSKTLIGDHVFVGSDTMLVAPVNVGDNALIGAASCITRDVPAGALALERNEQLIKEQWADLYWQKLKEED